MKRVKGVFSSIVNHKKRSLIIIIILAVVGFILYPKPPKPLETATVKRNDIVQSISATGTIDADKSVNLNFLTAGKLVYIGAKKGDTVKAGQTIATLDQRSLQKNLEQTLRTYSEQRNSFDTLQESNQNHTPQDALNISMKRLLQNNQYDLEKTIASVELQQLVLEQSVLTTPISGVLVRSDAEIAGVNITPTTTYTVADPTTLVFKMDVDEADIGKISAGQSVELSFDAFPDTTLTVPIGAIDFVSHKSDTGGNVYTVEANLPESAIQNYRIGMTGDAQIITARQENALIVPLGSVTDDTYVYVKTLKSFEKRKVQLGLENDTDAVVISGVEAGDKVAIDPEAAKALVEKASPLVQPGQGDQ